MATTYLTFTTGSAGNRAKWTWSGWVKKTDLTANGTLFFAGGSNNDYSKILLQSSGQLFISEVGGGSTVWEVQTNRKFRDPSAYYHMVFVYDSAQSTASNRLKIYINGVQETSFATASYPAQNRGAMWLAGGTEHRIGRDYVSQYFGGIISDVNFSEGYALAPTVWGETDTDTGEWRIKDNPSFSLGTYGFTILKNGSTITDQSSNSNNWSLGGGTLTNTKDCPANVFATLNPLSSFYYGGTFSNGNCSTVSGANGYYSPITSTLGMLPTSGKYYAEVKFDVASTTIYSFIGITGSPINETNKNIGGRTYGYAYAYNGQKFNNNSGSSYGNGYVEGDIIGIAFDATNSKIYFSKNGTWQNSGDPTSGATGTGSAFTVSTTPTQGFYFFGCSDDNNGSGTSAWSWNFGNGTFGTTAVSSAGTNASGIGIFEYDVPTGYTALSTKGLNI